MQYMMQVLSPDIVIRPAQLQLIRMQGVLVFLAGNALQCHSHWVLARLRASIAGKRMDLLQTTADGYAVPQGGAFMLVSCPHYLGEIVIYLGLTLILGRNNLCIWVVLAWVVSLHLPTPSFFERLCLALSGSPPVKS